jgi:peptide/nickel transport system substrate-binding protein
MPMTRRGICWAIVGWMALVGLWAWGRTAHTAHAAPQGQVTWAIHFTIAPTYFEPAEHQGIITPMLFYYALHDALVKPMPGNVMAPSLAESWAESPDGLVYEFQLRQGVRFHNGDPFTAEDVVFSFERYKGAAANELKARVRAVEAVDPHRVRFHLQAPWPDFMATYATPATGAAWIVPKAYIGKVGGDGFKQHPVGAGPYRFVSQDPGVGLILEANEHYWRKVPHVKRLVLKSIPEDTTRLAMLKRGEADIAYGVMGAVAEEIQRDPTLTLVPVLGTVTQWVDIFAQWDPASPWADVRVRRAANHAIDRQAISDAESLGHSKPTGSIIPRAMDFALPLEPPAYDPEKSRHLLRDAGFPNGFDGGEIAVGPPYGSVAEAIANFLGAVGIRTKVRLMERAAFTTARRERQMKYLSFGGSGAYGNAATRLEAFVVGGGTFAVGSLPEIDERFRQQAGERDPSKRGALLQEIQRLVHEQALFAPIWELAFISGVGPRVAESGLGRIPLYIYSAPYEDVRLK